MKILPLLFATLSFCLAKPIVSVSIPPQAFFFQKIAGDTLTINVLIAPDTDEHNFDFKPEIMANLEKSDMYFTIGLEFEAVMLARFQNLFNNLKVIDTRTNITLLNSTRSHHHGEHEIPHDSHDEHPASDPHIWLDPALVKVQATTIANALIAAYPQNRALYERNLATFLDEITALDGKIHALFMGKTMRKFIVYHPSWAYFANAYELVQIPIEIEGKEAKARDLAQLIALAKAENITTIFIPQGFPQDSVKPLAREIGANIVELNHLPFDWDISLLQSAQKIAQSLR